MTTLRCGNDAVMMGPGHRPLIMGIVNVTPDSMSDGGLYLQTDRAVAHALSLFEEGADVVDIGGESTRPGAVAVSVDEEMGRILPVIAALVARGCRRLSVDTQHGETAAAALSAGAAWINDVSGGEDPALLRAAADADALIVMHRRSTTAAERSVSGDDIYYSDVVTEVSEHLNRCVARAVAAGVDANRVVVDPGLGFGKNVADNLRLLRAGHVIHSACGAPVLIGASRKRFLGAIVGEPEPRHRDIASIAAAMIAVQSGAHLLRVHNVRDHAQAIEVWSAL